MTLYNYSDKNKRRTWLLFSIFLVSFVIIAYIFGSLFDSPLILYLIIGFSVIFSLITYWTSDKMVLKMSQAKELKFEDNKEIYRLVENLCISVGLPLPKIYIINDPAPNAFATGRNPQKAVVALTTGLIEKLDRSELEGVIAHELSHIKNYDILLATVVTILVGVIVILADVFSRAVFYSNAPKNEKNNQGRIVSFILALFFAILAPLFAQLMQLAISRKREFLADADGALITRYPEGLARALEKISNDPRELKNVNQATAHLFIASPLKSKKRKGFMSRAFKTHPPIEDRIKALRGMNL